MNRLLSIPAILLAILTFAIVGCPQPENRVHVPDVVGMTQSEAESAIVSAALSVGTVNELFSSIIPAGEVMDQGPAAGSRVAEGTAVNLVTSKGPQEAGTEAETIFLPGDVLLEMVWIEKGTYMRGRSGPDEQDSRDREDPRHEVTLTADFWMGKFSVTKGQWTALMDTTPWEGHSDVINDPDSPAVFVSWHDAQDFIAALNHHIEQTAQGPANVRLPSEAEWEYAARAGTTARFYWGDDPEYTGISGFAWWRGNSRDVGNEYAHVVGQKAPNDWGLYDMSGNVREWCQDWSGDYPAGPVVDPTGPASGTTRRTRGGSWWDWQSSCRSAYRGGSIPSFRSDFIGFRLSR